MKEVIHDRHGDQASGTYINGQMRIDRIFATCSINIKKGGYASFEQGVQGQRTDHRCLWIDISTESLFGSKTPPLMPFNRRRVKSKHPKIANRFNDSYKDFAIRNQLPPKIYQLEADVQFPITEEQQMRAEKIAQLQAEGIQYANKRCRQ